MESDNNMDVSASSGEQTGSRWTPTKDQIDLLEDLYRQGVRTPSADQIQQITTKLKAFGHIEAKNVFYWFQNHKARQRQKQKQENIALLNRFMIHTTPPPTHFTTYYRNVSWHPSFYVPPPPRPPPSELGYPLNYPKLPIQGCCNKKRPLPPDTINNTLYTIKRPLQEPMLFQEQNLPRQINGSEKGFFNSNEERCLNQETLNLFPLHPTGNLHARRDSISTPSTHISASGINKINESGNFGHQDQPFIDFLCMDGQFKSS